MLLEEKVTISPSIHSLWPIWGIAINTKDTRLQTFSFELRDFGAAVAKEEMSKRDKAKEAMEHLGGSGRVILGDLELYW